nr:MAG TPA: Late 100kD protein [Caudoviricetes sp.]
MRLDCHGNAPVPPHELVHGAVERIFEGHLRFDCHVRCYLCIPHR